MENYIILPMFSFSQAGSILGAGYGLYEGHKYSKKKPFYLNALCSYTGFICGSILGFAGGVLWPVTFAIAIDRMIPDYGGKSDADSSGTSPASQGLTTTKSTKVYETDLLF